MASGGPSELSDAALSMGILDGSGSGTGMAFAVILGLKRMVVSMEKKRRVINKEKKVGRPDGNVDMAFSLLTLMLTPSMAKR